MKIILVRNTRWGHRSYFPMGMAPVESILTFLNSLGPNQVSAIAGTANAILVVGLIYFARKQLEHLRDKEFMDKIRDEKYKFPDLDETDPQRELSGHFVRHWILNRTKPITTAPLSR